MRAEWEAHNVINAETKERVREIVQSDLDEYYHRGIAFGPIIVEPEVDQVDDRAPVYLDIKIIFDGDQKNLAPHWASGMIPRIRPKLMEIGVDEFPVPSFIAKNEWDEWLLLNRKARRGAD